MPPSWRSGPAEAHWRNVAEARAERSARGISRREASELGFVDVARGPRGSKGNKKKRKERQRPDGRTYFEVAFEAREQRRVDALVAKERGKQRRELDKRDTLIARREEVEKEVAATKERRAQREAEAALAQRVVAEPLARLGGGGGTKAEALGYEELQDELGRRLELEFAGELEFDELYQAMASEDVRVAAAGPGELKAALAERDEKNYVVWRPEEGRMGKVYLL